MVIPDKGFDNLERIPWKDRKGMGDESEKRFVVAIREYQLTVCCVSQHRDDPQNDLARHFPDMFVIELSTFVQVKNGRNSTKWSNVIAERKLYQACRQLYDAGSKVWIIWEMPDSKFYGNYVENLMPIGDISDVSRRRGSGTSALKFSKASLASLESLVNGTSNITQLPLFEDW